ncbi:1540_t:CDS:2 [Dentiscutata erythropus]|uniref:1540_t:CDS:1 n=1 Tax=Dentiscutata erythropus TaxID=1348616 RepID=A0A9N9JA15_9GLOM|nr:1540_t:CDS:2 [Dentiscutata erythropus]
MLKLAKIISGHSNKKKKEDINALRKSADTFKDYSATSIVDQTDHTNSSIVNQIENTSTDNTFNVESTSSTEEDPVWSTIEWNVQSSGIDEVSIITSNVWDDDNQQQVRNIRNSSSRKDGILRDDFEENVWADVQIVSSIPSYSFSTAELSNDIAQTENHGNKIPLTLHEKVGQLAQETLKSQGLLTPPSSPIPQNIENVSLFSSTKESVGLRGGSFYEDKAINSKVNTSEIDQMDHFNADASFGVSNIKSSFDDLLTESAEGGKDSTYNANIDRCDDLFVVNRKVDKNISLDSKESIGSAEHSYIKDAEISGQEVDRESNIARIENVQNDIMNLGNHDFIDYSDHFEVLTDDRKSNQGLAINFDHLGSLSDSASLWTAVLDILDNSKKLSQSIDEMSPSIEDLVYNAQE